MRDNVRVVHIIEERSGKPLTLDQLTQVDRLALTMRERPQEELEALAEDFSDEIRRRAALSVIRYRAVMGRCKIARAA